MIYGKSVCVILGLMTTIRQPVVCSRTAWECDCCCVSVLQQGVYGFDMQSDGTKNESAQSVISQEDLTFLSSPPIVLPVNKWQLLLTRGSHLLTHAQHGVVLSAPPQTGRSLYLDEEHEQISLWVSRTLWSFLFYCTTAIFLRF